MIKARSRKRWIIAWFDGLEQDLRYSFRVLMHSPGFTLAALLTLALGIGANTAIFSVLDAVLVKSVPYPNMDRLVAIHEALPKTPINVSWPDFLDWRAQNHEFDDMAAYVLERGTLALPGDERPVAIALTSSSIFPLLGVRPLLGRLPDESAPVAAISYELWRNDLKADPNIVGRTVPLSNRQLTVVGVLPSGFRFAGQRVDVFAPIELNTSDPSFTDRANHPGLHAIARLREGVSIARARSGMNTIMARLASAYPQSNKNETAYVSRLYDETVGPHQKPLFVLAGAAALVLLLACANVANLMLGRSIARQAEFGVRAALGAGRSRLIRQMMTESLVLALLGGGVGVGIGALTVKPLIAMAPSTIPNLVEAHMDGRALLFALLASTLSTVLFGLAPALRTAGMSLRMGERLRPTNQRLRSALLVTEVALAVIVVTGAGLLLRSLIATVRIDPGFRADRSGFGCGPRRPGR